MKTAKFPIISAAVFLAILAYNVNERREWQKFADANQCLPVTVEVAPSVYKDMGVDELYPADVLVWKCANGTTVTRSK